MKTLAGRKRGQRPAAAAEGETRGQVQSLIRALSILNAVAEDERGMTLSDIAQKVSLPLSTTHRHLTTMQQERFVRYDTQLGTWLVGVQAFLIGNAFVNSRNTVSMARPFMRELMEASGETVNLAVCEDGQAVYLEQVECQHTMRVFNRPGARVPMYCSAVGKALLAAMPEAEVGKILHKTGLTRLTDNTVVSPAALHAELATTRARGYASDNEEHNVGLRCVAAVICDELAQPIGAISVSGPLVRIGNARFPVLGAMVKDTAAAITAALGGRLKTY